MRIRGFDPCRVQLAQNLGQILIPHVRTTRLIRAETWVKWGTPQKFDSHLNLKKKLINRTSTFFWSIEGVALDEVC